MYYLVTTSVSCKFLLKTYLQCNLMCYLQYTRKILLSPQGELYTHSMCILRHTVLVIYALGTYNACMIHLHIAQHVCAL